MKILFDHHEPFGLAHGGFQIQIEETARALRGLGVDIEFLRWWDPEQAGDTLHFFGLPPLHTVERAQAKGVRVIITHLLTNTCNRSRPVLAAQAFVTRSLLALPPARGFCARMGWLSLRQADAVVVGLEAEARVMRSVWGVKRVHIVPLGLRAAFLSAPSAPEPSRFHLSPTAFLICVGTICQRKHQCELAEAAREAEVPILFLGKPQSEKDSYWKRFRSLCNDTTIRHLGHINDPNELAALYRTAAGFIHLSDGENWCFAAHEAAACGLPILLPDQPWSRELFGMAAAYWTPNAPLAPQIGRFARSCPKRRPPQMSPLSWKEVAQSLLPIYSGSAEVKRDG